MNKTFLTAVSAIALLAAGPAFAETKHPEPGSKAAAEASTGHVGKDVEKAWKNTKEDVSEAASNVSDAAKDAYKDAKQALNDNDNNAEFDTINVASHATAGNMIGQPIYNKDGERVAKVRDIILNKDGNAMMVVVGDGDFTGLGKLVAFDYSIITNRSPEGDVIAALDEKMIDTAASFSYDSDDDSDDVRVIPGNGYSVSELMDGKVVSPEGKTLANVDDIVFRNGQVDQVIVSFGGTLGIGGEKAAISYGEGDLKPNGDSIDLKFSASETTQFQQYKETALN